MTVQRMMRTIQGYTMVRWDEGQSLSDFQGELRTAYPSDAASIYVFENPDSLTDCFVAIGSAGALVSASVGDWVGQVDGLWQRFLADWADGSENSQLTPHSWTTDTPPGP